jgi:hypothetical protein
MGVNLSFLSLRRRKDGLPYGDLIGQPFPLTRPVFIVGCGRSGTTILGEMLGRHPQLAYLNEPRQNGAMSLGRISGVKKPGREKGGCN